MSVLDGQCNQDCNHRLYVPPSGGHVEDEDDSAARAGLVGLDRGAVYHTVIPLGGGAASGFSFDGGVVQFGTSAEGLVSG